MKPSGTQAHIYKHHGHILRLLKTLKANSTNLLDNGVGYDLNLPSLREEGVIYVIFMPWFTEGRGNGEQQ